ncbi:MAG: hypothetical protein A3F91_05930 [Flavobacteria bacterium RIFCSPLOWO2_12_FULL_35_11]|nr:MAG: hypothetical protein A3F91_05930 [Flavobacteria bacterium RIFCSPLOWO2_12_FULL_35_11]
MLVSKKSKFLYLYAFTLFILSALYGLLMRWNFAFPTKFIPYQNLLQSHSHVAFLGWGYLSVIGAIIYYFVLDDHKKSKVYKATLTILLVVIPLMLISFPLGGYKVFSVVLLAVFGLTSYVLSFRILKDLQGNNTSVKLIRYGIYYYLLSSLATWFLAFVIVTQGKTDLYYNTVYFYLHFLYNGFFVFALFGLLFKIFENQQIVISEKLKQHFFIYLNIACIPAYALSVLWSTNLLLFNVVGFVASGLQFISLVFLIKIMQQAFSQINWSFTSKLLLKFALISYSLKISSQILSAFPYIVEKSLALKPFFIIGYLHLFTLGFLSVFLFLIVGQFGKINLQKPTSKVGILLFLSGVFIAESLLFLQGFLFMFQFDAIKNYNFFLLIFSFLMIIGLLVIYINQFSRLPIIK